MSESPPPAPALKEIFDAACFREIAKELTTICPDFDAKRFLALTLPGLEPLSLMQRLRHMTEALNATLPGSYKKTLVILRKLAPRIKRGFVTLVLPDYVALYGQDDFDVSMEALKFFTPFGSSEFAVRHFLKLDMKRALKTMETWSTDADEAVRRLASEGSRPRLPWSFRLEPLVADPSPTLPILEGLKNDPSLYVRKSVANHLNDITKDHPTWVLDLVEGWPMEDEHTAWIVKHALRTLIKKGDQRALAVIGAGEKADVVVHDFKITPQKIHLGESITLSFQVESLSKRSQRLVVDYTVHYVKKSGGTSAKVFKLKELNLGAGEKVTITRKQSIKDFTTRVHHAGRHEVEITINGASVARDTFELMK